ncbi:MAG: hypothetical protein ACE5RK_06895, partial [Candidatus Nitrosomaritimum aestuariumsis]
MKKSELRRLIARYQEVQIKMKKSQNNRLKKETGEIEQSVPVWQETDPLGQIGKDIGRITAVVKWLN